MEGGNTIKIYMSNADVFEVDIKSPFDLAITEFCKMANKQGMVKLRDNLYLNLNNIVSIELKDDERE